MSNGDAHYKADRDETRMVIGIWMNMIKVAWERPRYIRDAVKNVLADFVR